MILAGGSPDNARLAVAALAGGCGGAWASRVSRSVIAKPREAGRIMRWILAEVKPGCPLSYCLESGSQIPDENQRRSRAKSCAQPRDVARSLPRFVYAMNIERDERLDQVGLE